MHISQHKQANLSWWKKINQVANDYEWVMLLVCIMIFLRLSTLFEPLWYGDEAIYLAIGKALKSGLNLYQEVTDFPNKPPMIYWLASVTGSVSVLRFLTMIWQIPGVIAFYYLSSKLTNLTSAFFSTLAFIFLTSTPILEGNIANAEIFFIVPTLISFNLLYSKRLENLNEFKTYLKWFLSGLLLAVGFLFKIHVLLDIFTLFIVFGLFPWTLNKNFSYQLKLFLGKLLSWGLGFSLLLIPVILYFISNGITFQDLISDLSGSKGYASAWQESNFIAQTLGMGSLAARTILLVLISSLIFIFRYKIDRRVSFVSLWLFATLFAALLSQRPYSHYLIQLIAPLVLCVSLLMEKISFKSRLMAISLLSLTILAFLRFDFFFWPVKNYYQNFIQYTSNQIDKNEYYRNFDQRMPRNYEIASQLRNLTSKEDKIFIWGNEADIYVLADRVQSGRLVVSFHADDLAAYDETIEYLKTSPPEIILIMESEKRSFNKLKSFVSSNYFLIDKIGDPDLNQSENQGNYGLIYKKIPFGF